MNHCHPFLPIVDISPTDTFTSVQRYPSLFSAILAISARFYLRHSATSCPIDSHVPTALADIAESHLAHTLLRKEHTLADVQTVLLLAGVGIAEWWQGARCLGLDRACGTCVQEAGDTSSRWACRGCYQEGQLTA